MLTASLFLTLSRIYLCNRHQKFTNLFRTLFTDPKWLSLAALESAAYFSAISVLLRVTLYSPRLYPANDLAFPHSRFVNLGGCHLHVLERRPTGPMRTVVHCNHGFGKINISLPLDHVLNIGTLKLFDNGVYIIIRCQFFELGPGSGSYSKDLGSCGDGP